MIAHCCVWLALTHGRDTRAAWAAALWHMYKWPNQGQIHWWGKWPVFAASGCHTRHQSEAAAAAAAATIHQQCEISGTDTGDGCSSSRSNLALSLILVANARC
jgi:hypothetical protein